MGRDATRDLMHGARAAGLADFAFARARRFDSVLRRKLSVVSHRAVSLPIVILMPHEGCNARCVMCDIWRLNANGVELSIETLRSLLPELAHFRTERIILSGGEALLHSSFEAFATLLAGTGAKLTLLTTGFTLGRSAEAVRTYFDEVVVSLDGPASIHDEIRRVPGAFRRMEEGVHALLEAPAHPRITARSTVQRRNFRSLESTIDEALSVGFAQISFLAVDGTSNAFARAEGEAPGHSAIPTLEEAHELSRSIEELATRRPELFATGFVAESPEKLQRIARLFAALAGKGELRAPRCNAPWISTVVEADGTVRPCFFHAPIGKIGERSLSEIVGSERAVSFRRNLDVASNEVCRRCVCSLEVGPFGQV